MPPLPQSDARYGAGVRSRFALWHKGARAKARAAACLAAARSAPPCPVSTPRTHPSLTAQANRALMHKHTQRQAHAKAGTVPSPPHHLSRRLKACTPVHTRARAKAQTHTRLKSTIPSRLSRPTRLPPPLAGRSLRLALPAQLGQQRGRLDGRQRRLAALVAHLAARAVQRLGHRERGRGGGGSVKL